MARKSILDKFRKYHFEFKHITIIFIILLCFQVFVSLINNSSIKNLLGQTQEWYQKDSAEKMANLTTTSLELILETLDRQARLTEEDKNRLIESFNIIFSQQLLQHNIQEMCLLVDGSGHITAIDDGRQLFNYLFSGFRSSQNSDSYHTAAIKYYQSYQENIKNTEQILSVKADENTFYTFVPFILRGEYKGAVYVKNTADFSFITSQIISSFDETFLIYLSLISLGLLSMYFVSTYTVRERDEAQKLFLIEQENHIKKQINYEKELVFTKRIYHTHHKAEKVMGFIKGDLATLSPDNIKNVKYRVTKYANFISRIIYDMKWFDPPIQTIRNQIFKTNINDVIKFIVEHIFLRSYAKSISYNINLDLDETIPVLGINEFVIWEIIEPLIQNSIDHSNNPDTEIVISTKFDPDRKKIILKIIDNGQGIMPALLAENDRGVRKIFEENISTKKETLKNTGYGCYISSEISRRCGWKLDAANLPEGGCEFIINIDL